MWPLKDIRTYLISWMNIWDTCRFPFEVDLVLKAVVEDERFSLSPLQALICHTQLGSVDRWHLQTEMRPQAAVGWANVGRHLSSPLHGTELNLAAFTGDRLLKVSREQSAGERCLLAGVLMASSPRVEFQLAPNAAFSQVFSLWTITSEKNKMQNKRLLKSEATLPNNNYRYVPHFSHLKD